MKNRMVDAEAIALEILGTVPIGKRRKAGRPANVEMVSNLHRVRERRGYQRFYYHVATSTVSHWWDHQEILNNLQMDLEKLYGAIVELVAVRELRGAGLDGQALVFHFYFKIGPIPDPADPFPVPPKSAIV
jgi:hypothetical protein